MKKIFYKKYKLKKFNKENAKEKVKSLLRPHLNSIDALFDNSLALSQHVRIWRETNNLSHEEQVQLMHIIFSETKSLFLDMGDGKNQYQSAIKELDDFKLFMIDSIDSEYEDREVA